MDRGPRALSFFAAGCFILAVFLCSCGGAPKNPSIPAFNSTPPSNADEGEAYSYALSATDPSGTAVSYQLRQGPAGASLSNALLTWMPSADQARAANSFVVDAITSSGGRATQTWTVTPSGTIRGTNLIHYVGALGEQTVPVDLSNTLMSSLVQNSAGGWDRIPVTGTAQGTFTIPHVPAGYFWLVGFDDPFTSTATNLGLWLWTSKGNIDLGYSRTGRQPTILFPIGLDLTLTGLSPLGSNSDDYFYVVNPNEAVFIATTAPGIPGSTSDLLSLDPGYAIDPTKGDQLYVMQNSYSGTPVPFYTAVKGSPPVSLLTSGGTTSATIPMLDPSLTQMEINVKGSAFASLLTDLSPSSQPLSSAFWVAVHPFAPTNKIQDNLEIPVFTYGTGGGSGPPLVTDSDLGSAQFGNPFPAGWPTYSHFTYSAMIPFAGGASCDASVWMTSATLPSTTSALAPVMGPPLNVKLDGVDWSTARPNITASPTLSWNVPRLGLASGFLVQVWTMVGGGPSGPPSPEAIAQLLTTQSSVTIPTAAISLFNPSVIWFKVYALQDSVADYASAPGWFAFESLTPQTFAGASACSPTFKLQ